MENEIEAWLLRIVRLNPSVAKQYTALFDEVGLDSLEFFAGEDEITGTFLEDLGIRRYIH